MEPNSFTKTSFCNVEIDNITTNESKEYILNQMSILCSGIQYNSRYAKIYNEQYAHNLKNPHIFCLKSSGNPYLLFLSQINTTNYCFLIDKKMKEGYSYPKIFILPYSFTNEYYQGSLYECELIRDTTNNWSLMIGDCYYHKGKNMNKTIIMDRINTIHTTLTGDYLETDFSKICPIYIKKYFDYKDKEYVMNQFIPNLPYNIRGFYFVPLRTSYSKILYLFPKDNNKYHAKKQSVKKVIKGSQKEVQKVVQKEVVQKDYLTFRIMKTLKADVYELYLKDEDNLKKQGIALVQSIHMSHQLVSYFKNKNQLDEVYVKCKKNPRFKKWEPYELSHEPISNVTEI